QEWVDWICDTQPTRHPADLGACWRLARVYVRIELSGRALDEVDAKLAGRAGAAYVAGREWLARLREDHDRWLSRAGKIEAELGRTPAARAKLLLHVGQGAAIHQDLLRKYAGGGDA